MSEVVKLNVGGRKFTTTKTTLMGTGGHTYFTGLLSGKFAVTMDEDGAYFIDRNGDYFPVILEFLRSGNLIGTDTIRHDILYSEVQFYAVESMLAQLDAVQNDIAEEARAKAEVKLRYQDEGCYIHLETGLAIVFQRLNPPPSLSSPRGQATSPPLATAGTNPTSTNAATNTSTTTTTTTATATTAAATATATATATTPAMSYTTLAEVTSNPSEDLQDQMQQLLNQGAEFVHSQRQLQHEVRQMARENIEEGTLVLCQGESAGSSLIDKLRVFLEIATMPDLWKERNIREGYARFVAKSIIRGRYYREGAALKLRLGPSNLSIAVSLSAGSKVQLLRGNEFVCLEFHAFR
eukprot:TRINITY_DN5355_c0_g8_i1.p1 TRINITY_DN5355_c0_g8~~TRINITY_DN5355_c0_g8_i1.p1  ORF type:complete len:351 (-),score=81.89 TRINITY_DN5355_c0_g8_i1:60-1112(-)